MTYLKKVYFSKWFWLIEHLLFIAIPISFYMASPTPLVWFLTMGFSLVYVFWIDNLFQIRGFSWNYSDFLKAIKFLFLPTILIIAALVLLKPYFPQLFLTNTNFFVWQYVLLSVPLQELLFRGFCLQRCSLSFKDKRFIILFNSLLFASYHMIFGNWYFVVGIFLVNLIWSYAFLKYPNIYAVMISHAILGLVYFYQ